MRRALLERVSPPTDNGWLGHSRGRIGTLAGVSMRTTNAEMQSLKMTYLESTMPTTTSPGTAGSVPLACVAASGRWRQPPMWSRRKLSPLSMVCGNYVTLSAEGWSPGGPRQTLGCGRRGVTTPGAGYRPSCQLPLGHHSFPKSRTFLFRKDNLIKTVTHIGYTKRYFSWDFI